jgi:hypothetical protein
MMLRSSLIQWSAGLDPALAGIRRVILWMNIFCMFLGVSNSRTIFKRDLPVPITLRESVLFPITDHVAPAEYQKRRASRDLFPIPATRSTKKEEKKEKGKRNKAPSDARTTLAKTPP